MTTSRSSPSTARRPTPSRRSSSSELSAAFVEIETARAIVLGSALPGIFSAGWDLPLLVDRDRVSMEEFVSAYCDLVRQIFIAGPPVIAALPGHAIAGGLIVAMAADERIAAEGKGKFGLSEVILGVSVPQCLMEPFRHVLGARQMERLAVTGENRTVEEALAIGLIDRVGARGGARRARLRTGAHAGRPLGPGPRRDQAALAGCGAGSLRRGARSRPLPRFLVLGRRAPAGPRHGRPALEPGVIPADEILEALDLSRAEPGSGFLEALFVRFNDRVPFESASKIVRDADVAEADSRNRARPRSSGPTTRTRHRRDLLRPRRGVRRRC